MIDPALLNSPNLISLASGLVESDRLQGLLLALKTKIEVATVTDLPMANVFMKLCQAAAEEFAAARFAYEHDQPSALSLGAWRARNLLELLVWTTYCVKNDANARRFFEDVVRDCNDGFKSIKTRGEKAGLDPHQMSELDISMGSLKKSALPLMSAESVDERFTEIGKAAESLGVDFLAQYSVSNKLLSKYAHPTAFLILNERSDAQIAQGRFSFYYQSNLYFVQIFNLLEAHG